MKITVQIIVEHEDLEEPIVEEIGCLCRGELMPETLGLTLQEGKDLLANIQAKMVKYQAKEYVAQQRPCPHCGRQRSNKGKHEIVWRSLFGKLKIHSPRLYACSCQLQKKKSFSPLANLLTERSAPELNDEVVRKLYRRVQEFITYINNNGHFIPNYGERYWYGETISTAFVESTINWVVSKRMVKK